MDLRLGQMCYYCGTTKKWSTTPCFKVPSYLEIPEDMNTDPMIAVKYLLTCRKCTKATLNRLSVLSWIRRMRFNIPLHKEELPCQTKT